jgi:hypothetical protein
MNRHVGRNDLCPCFSGKKYKKCCLPKDQQEEREILVKANSAGNNDDGEAQAQLTKTSVTNRWRRPKAKQF